MSLGPYQVQRIRLLLQSPTAQPSDQLSSGVSFEVGTGIQFELARSLNGALIDASLLSSVTFAIKPSSNEDATAIVSATVAPSSIGWNSNAAMTAGSNVVPSYAGYYGSGASITCTVSGGVVQSSFSITNGSTLYTGGAAVVFVPTNGGSGAAATLTVVSGVITAVTLTSGGTGYTGAPTMLVVPIYVVGVQQGAAYTWTGGENDLTLSNGGTLVAGSDIVPNGSYYSAGAFTLSGLASGSYYYFVLGADDTSVAELTSSSSPFFKAGGTTAALVGSGVTAVTTQVYPATIGPNIVSGSLVYPATSQYANLSAPYTAFLTFIGGTSTTTYGAANGANPGGAVLSGLTPGSSYFYTLSSNDTSFNGITSAQQQSGFFTAGASTVNMAGTPGATITSKIYASVSLQSSATLNGLVVGSTYYWTKNANDSALSNGSTTMGNNGFFTATTGQATLTGSGGSAVTAAVQLMSETTTGSFIAVGNTVTLTGVAGQPSTATITGNVGWNQTNDQLCIVPFTQTQTALSTPPGGGSTNYWFLVTAQTTSGVQVVLGSGTLQAVDSGQGTLNPQNGNVVPSGVSYDGSGNYSLAVTPGSAYQWTPGSGADTGAAGTLSSTAFIFLATTSTVVLTGTPSAAVGATVYAVNTYPLKQVVALSAGATGYTVSGLALSFAPVGAEMTIMIPTGGQMITAYLEYPTLSTTGATWVFSSPIPATGYYGRITFD